MTAKAEKPYGHVAVIEVFKKGGNFMFNEKERKTIRRKGGKQRVESAARLTPRFAGFVSIEGLTEEQWINGFGTGGER